MAQPLLVEVIAYAPTAYYHCMHCEVVWREAGVPARIHTEQVDSSLPPEMAQEYQQVSDWVRELCQRYGDRILIKVIDAASLEGFGRSLRYGVRRFPAVVVDHQARFSAGAFEQAGQEIERQLGQVPAAQGI